MPLIAVGFGFGRKKYGLSISGPQLLAASTVGLDLLPREVGALFGERGVERGHVLLLLGSRHQLLVALRAHQDGNGLARALEHHRLGPGGLDDPRQVLAVGADAQGDHAASNDSLSVLYAS